MGRFFYRIGWLHYCSGAGRYISWDVLFKPFGLPVNSIPSVHDLSVHLLPPQRTPLYFPRDFNGSPNSDRRCCPIFWCLLDRRLDRQFEFLDTGNSSFKNRLMSDPIPPLTPPAPDPIRAVKPTQSDYYTSKGKKWADFAIGFFGFALLAWLLWSAMSGISSDLAGYAIPIGAVAMIALIIIFFRRGRRFISIGILSTLLTPFVYLGLAMGYCFIAASTGNLY